MYLKCKEGVATSVPEINKKLPSSMDFPQTKAAFVDYSA
jgi:hypothetical protein